MQVASRGGSSTSIPHVPAASRGRLTAFCHPPRGWNDALNPPTIACIDSASPCGRRCRSHDARGVLSPSARARSMHHHTASAATVLSRGYVTRRRRISSGRGWHHGSVKVVVPDNTTQSVWSGANSRNLGARGSRPWPGGLAQQSDCSTGQADAVGGRAPDPVATRCWTPRTAALLAQGATPQGRVRRFCGH